MNLLVKLFLNAILKKSKSTISDHIFYKIVDVVNDTQEYVLQCINTDSVFRTKITDIVFDTDLLYSLHPIQACFIGIEYAKYIKKHNISETQNNKKLNKYHTPRYGKYSLCYQERTGHICFIATETDEEFVMDPCDVALSEELIKEFDAPQAFHIGLLAGLKPNEPIKNCEDTKLRKPNLQLITYRNNRNIKPYENYA